MTDFNVDIIAADGTRIALRGELHVGRSNECEIIIEDSGVSRRHAALRVRDQQVFLEDLDSVNGSSVNGIPVKGEIELADGDKLRFDTHSYVLAIKGGATSGAPAGGEQATEIRAAVAETDRVGTPVACADLPGSWVDSGSGNQTIILSAEDVAGAAASAGSSERGSDLPHLVVVDAEGQRAGVIELQATQGQDVWEIGRAAPCEIVLNAPSVSEHHAQLIHQDGRWRLVNLVSTNGIYVNGEKKLTAYLADSDEIRLGTVTLVFRTAVGPSSALPAAGGATALSNVQPRRARRTGWMLVAVAALALVIGWLTWGFL